MTSDVFNFVRDAQPQTGWTLNSDKEKKQTKQWLLPTGIHWIIYIILVCQYISVFFPK